MNKDKKLDEIYCPECGKPIKRNAVVCPYCGIQVKQLVLENKFTEIKDSPKTTSTKTKTSAVVLAVFFGLFAWLYTVKRSAIKFIIGFFTLLTIFILYVMTELYFLVRLNSIAFYAIWIWAIVDNATKPRSFYENYPKE